MNKKGHDSVIVSFCLSCLGAFVVGFVVIVVLTGNNNSSSLPEHSEIETEVDSDTGYCMIKETEAEDYSYADVYVSNQVKDGVIAYKDALARSDCEQPDTYFPNHKDRFELVDSSIQDIGNTKYICRVFADKYMGTMYLWMAEYSNGIVQNASMTQIFYEDGSPMIYDNDEGAE